MLSVIAGEPCPSRRLTVKTGARYRLHDVWNLRWDWISGGIGAPAPHRFIHGYVMCDGMLDGELSHSCRHGPPPHEIKVCITKKGNEKVWKHVLARLEEDEQRRAS